MYSYYDRKSNKWDTPFFCMDDVMAERKMIMDLKNEQSLIAQFKDDFVLYKVGTFNVIEGKQNPEPMKILIREGKQIAKKLEENN